MHFVRHYLLFRYEKTELETLLETKYHIPVDVTELLENNPYLVTFDIHENHPQIEEINRLLPINGENAKICSLGIELEPPIGWYEYSEKDRREAKWLEISSHNQKVCPTNRNELFTGHCLKDESLREKDYLYVQGQGVFSKYWHEDIKLDTVVNSSIYFGKKFFASDECDPNILYCNKEARDLMEKDNLRGIMFHSVRKKSTGLPIDGMYRLSSTYTVPDEAVEGIESAQEFHCPICGMKMLRALNQRCRYGIKSEMLDKDVDFYSLPPMIAGVTSEIEYTSGESTFIVSQRMYQFLKRNKLCRGLVFVPLETV